MIFRNSIRQLEHLRTSFLDQERIWIRSQALFISGTFLTGTETLDTLLVSFTSLHSTDIL